MSQAEITKIDQLLLDNNKDSHEASTCLTCSTDTTPRGGIWYPLSGQNDDLPLRQPVYIDTKEKKVLAYPISHNLIIGSTGSGKTTVLYNNWIDYYSHLPKNKRPSFMVFDLKGDIYTKHAKELTACGYNVEVINAKMPFASARYNPLTKIFDSYHAAIDIRKKIEAGKIKTNFEGVRYPNREQANLAAAARAFEHEDNAERYISELANILIECNDPKNASWFEGARMCFKAILYTMLHRSTPGAENPVTREQFTLENACRIAYHTDDDYEPLIQWLRYADDIAVVKAALGSCYDINAKITRDGYVSSLNAELGKFSSSAISALTKETDIDFDAIAKGKEDHAIFIITDDRRQATNMLAIMMMNELINVLTETADANPSHMLDKDFIIFADELANLPKLPGLSNKIATLRSRKIWIQLAVQSLEQLAEVYGENVMQTIVDNCDIHFFLGSNNAQTKAHFSTSMGERIAIQRSANIGAGGNITISEVTSNAPVVFKSDLEKLELGEFFVRSRNCQNLRSSMPPFFMRTDVQVDEGEYVPVFRHYDPNENAYSIIPPKKETKKSPFDF